MPTYNNKVVLRNGTVVLDVTPTTAIESDVASGKIFVKADGSLGTGTASGGDNVFVVNLSWDDDFLPEYAEEPGAWVPDQTWAEIKAAGDAGKEITVIASDDFHGTLPAAGHYYSESEPPNGLAYSVISFVDDKMIEYDYSISGTGIDFYGEYAAIFPNFDSPSRTYTPSDQVQTETITATPGHGYNGIEEVSITVNAMPTGTAGTPFATKIKTGQNTMQVRPAVTNVSGYINGGTIAGDPVTVDAYEVVKGTYTVDSSGTKDVTNYASASVPSGTEGTPTATKGSVSNHAVTVTPSVTNTTGFITGSTKTGTGVSVTAAELVSGTKQVSANGTDIDVTNYQKIDVAVPSGGIRRTIAENTYSFSNPDDDGTKLVSDIFVTNGAIVLGNTYTVTFNNVEYTCVAGTSSSGDVGVGSLNYAFSDYPFFITSYQSGNRYEGWWAVKRGNTGSKSIKVETVEESFFTAETLNVSANGTYNAPTGKVYDSVVVAVPAPTYSTIRTGSTTPSSSLGVDGDVYIQV